MESIIVKVKEEFQKILEYIVNDAQKQQIHEVERQLFVFLVRLGWILMKLFLEAKGNGNVGETHSDAEGVIRPLHTRKKEKIYFSIFGKIVIERAYYWLKGKGGLCPLDEELNLPEDSYSYLLGEWATLLGVRQAYNKGGELLKKIFGVEIWNEPIKTMMSQASEKIDEFYDEQPVPEAESEGEILVVTADCKGVPVIKEQPAQPKKRLKKGEKPGKKKMSTVTAVYTIERHERSVEDVVKEVLETDKQLKGVETKNKQEENSSRPKPKNKIVRATMQGKEKAFEKLEKAVAQRDPQQKKARVALVDGEHKLRKLIDASVMGFIIILDLFHVLEYLWQAAHVFYKDGSEEAESWVKINLRMLLRGQVAKIIENLRHSLKNHRWSPSKRYALSKVITYLENGQEYMKYDVYLAKGYPIGSGVVEGACRNLVKDRMELAGMRWTLEGAQAVLQMRSADVNGMWENFWNFRIQKEYEKLYQSYANTGSKPKDIAA